MEFIDKRTIKLDRTLSELDKFVLGVISILEKKTKYVIVSGYVSILFGRTRTTEDIDIIIPPLEKPALEELYGSLKDAGYWFVNSESADELFGMLREFSSVRIAKKNMAVPNIEIKFAKDEPDKISLDSSIRVILGERSLQVSPLELQIAYKERILGSKKDLEDARHLFEVFKGNIDEKRLGNYREELR